MSQIQCQNNGECTQYCKESETVLDYNREGWAESLLCYVMLLKTGMRVKAWRGEAKLAFEELTTRDKVKPITDS